MIEIRNVDVFIGENQILRDVSLRVQENETVAVIGANGAGKTSLIKTILGLLKVRRGSVKVKDTELGALAPHQIVTLGISCVPEGRRVFRDMSVRENLEMGAYLPRARSRLVETLDWVTELFPILKTRWKQRAGTLSGGEQQMLAIARALMSKPEYLLIDELSLGLAPVLVKEIYRQLRKIREEMTVLLVEQNVEQALKNSDRAYVLETGRLVREAPSQDLLHDPHVRKAYLGL